jgi:hypothetical protein
MKKIISLVALMLIIGAGSAFAVEANKMPHNGVTIFEETAAVEGSTAAESNKTFYNGVTIFSTGSAMFDNPVVVSGGLVQFTDCAPEKSTLSKTGANSTISCDTVIGSCI